jgi:hypothetical protein
MLGVMCEFRSLCEVPPFTRDDEVRSHIERPLESSWKKHKLFLWLLLPSVVRSKR